MIKRSIFFAASVGVAAMLASTASLAGEVNGSQTNFKDDFSKGLSFCKFSGLNDDPTGIDPEANGPPGRVQNYGHELLLGLHDPTTGDNPGFGCNPTLNPLPPELLNR
jgi:hypothetical protein